jgi:hypothetical protein
MGQVVQSGDSILDLSQDTCPRFMLIRNLNELVFKYTVNTTEGEQWSATEA